MDNRPIYIYITPFFPSASRWQGGFCYDAVRALMHDGRYEVSVFLTGDSNEDYDYNGIRVHCLRRLKLPLDCAPFLFARLNGWLFKRKLKSLGIDIASIAVCHANMEPEYSFAIKQANPKVKVLWQTHWMGAPFSLSIYRLGVLKGLSDLLFLHWRRMLEAMDVVVVLSELHKSQFGMAYPDGPLGRAIDMREQTLFRRYRKIAPKRIRVFYNGIDTSVFCNKNRLRHRGFVIGCVGNFGPTKGQMTLVKAFEEVSKSILDAKLVFVGSGLCFDECKKVAESLRLGERIVFEKECDHLKLADKYRSFDLFVLPSWQEGFCCVLVEAVGCGTPAMATDAISFKEVIPEEDWGKWLIKPMDHVALAAKIIDYHDKKCEFRFNRSMDINDLWEEFLNEI